MNIELQDLSLITQTSVLAAGAFYNFISLKSNLSYLVKQTRKGNGVISVGIGKSIITLPRTVG